MEETHVHNIYALLLFDIAGVIDEDYRGNVGVILFNFSDTDFEINEGDRVAQLICEKICYPDIVEVEVKTKKDIHWMVFSCEHLTTIF